MNSLDDLVRKHPSDTIPVDLSRNVSFRKFIEVLKFDVEPKLKSDLLICLDRIDYLEAIDEEITSRLMLFAEVRNSIAFIFIYFYLRCNSMVANASDLYSLGGQYLTIIP